MEHAFFISIPFLTINDRWLDLFIVAAVGVVVGIHYNDIDDGRSGVVVVSQLG
jgi:hypothetical protein